MFNFIRALCVIFFFAALTACGKQMSDNERAAMLVPILTGAAIIGTSGGGSDNAPATMTENPAPTMSVTMPEPMEPAASTTLAFDSPELGGVFIRGTQLRRWIVLLSATAEGTPTVLFGYPVIVARMSVVNLFRREELTLSELDRADFHANGNLNPLVRDGITITQAAFTDEVAFQNRPTITALVQLCPVSWFIALYERLVNFSANCPAMGGMSYSPDMRRVVYAAMAEGFNRGVGIGESPFAFSGRYDGDNRAAGFTYDMGGYALRTDYIRLPSRQDGEVWLDTYRFGALTRLNDETRFFAGVDNYKNAIIVMDTNANNGENLHRLGFAVGEGYAIKYEYRLNL